MFISVLGSIVIISYIAILCKKNCSDPGQVASLDAIRKQHSPRVHVVRTDVMVCSSNGFVLTSAFHRLELTVITR